VAEFAALQPVTQWSASFDKRVQFTAFRVGLCWQLHPAKYFLNFSAQTLSHFILQSPPEAVRIFAANPELSVTSANPAIRSRTRSNKAFVFLLPILQTCLKPKKNPGTQ
jgi:hypothetical protein